MSATDAIDRCSRRTIRAAEVRGGDRRGRWCAAKLDDGCHGRICAHRRNATRAEGMVDRSGWWKRKRASRA